ncbi:MAG: VWA domain-containing protein [Syntrophaceae bacterium]|nr:VWA domain-containing protein [Syntrophaceae bacterium]
MEDKEIKLWNEFARELRRRSRWDLDRIEDALADAMEALPVLDKKEREELLRIGWRVAERSSKLAVAFLRLGPKKIGSHSPAIRPFLIQWAIIFADHSRETLIDFLERSQETLAFLPEEETPYLLSRGLDLARLAPSISYKFFLNLSKISKEVSRDRFSPWFEEGRSLIPQSIPAALAYFSLESRRSQSRAAEEPSSVSLEEVSRFMKLFAQALTGRSLGLRPLQETKNGIQNSAGPFPCTDGETIFLPAVAKQFSTREMNFLAFKLATVHQAGYVEFGTFNFRLSAVQDLFPPEFMEACLRGISDKGKEISSLEAFFHLFPRKELARDLFHVLEGARVDHCLQREYRGLKKEMDFFLPMAMGARPPVSSLPLQQAFLESLLRWELLGEPLSPAFLAFLSQGADLTPHLMALPRPGAGVKESARAAVLLYRKLSRIPNLKPAFTWEAYTLPPLTLPLSPMGGIDPASRLVPGEEPYQNLAPLPHWGELRPELVQKKLRLRAVQNLLNQMEMGIPLSPEILKALLESGMELEVSPGGEGDEFQGLFITDLKGLKKPIGMREANHRAKEKLKKEIGSILGEVAEETGEDHHYYDEWDCQIADYRVRWCRLKEKDAETGSTEFVDRTLESYSDLVAEVRRQFQMLKPERFKKIPNLERGEEIDLNAAVEASVDRKAGQSPSEKIYIEKNRKDRDFSTLFLLDMSASTDEWVEGKNRKPEILAQEKEKKIIDIEKEALVVMAEALEEIGDEYAIYGFSGYGRKEVEFYAIKDFQEEYGDRVKGRIEKIKPQRSTRMGTAIRHAAEKMAGRESKIKNLILISDGYPQDYDYGEDRSDKEYALQDTLIALEEAGRKQIHTFCITVDRAGHDYLRKMMPPSRYLVIEETAALPRELPKIYRKLTT